MRVWLVGVRGFEPPAPASRTQCSTRLSYTPAKAAHIALGVVPSKVSLQARGLATHPAMQMRQLPQQRRDAIDNLIELARSGIGELGGNRRLDRSQKGRCGTGHIADQHWLGVQS